MDAAVDRAEPELDSAHVGASDLHQFAELPATTPVEAAAARRLADLLGEPAQLNDPI